MVCGISVLVVNAAAYVCLAQVFDWCLFLCLSEEQMCDKTLIEHRVNGMMHVSMLPVKECWHYICHHTIFDKGKAPRFEMRQVEVERL